MKRILAIAVLVLTSVPAMAQYHGPRYNHHHHGYHRSGGWVAPLVLGGVVGYAMTRSDPVVQQPAVILPPPAPVIYSAPAPACTPWTETQSSDGTITRTRTCTQ